MKLPSFSDFFDSVVERINEELTEELGREPTFDEVNDQAEIEYQNACDDYADQVHEQRKDERLGL